MFVWRQVCFNKHLFQLLCFRDPIYLKLFISINVQDRRNDLAETRLRASETECLFSLARSQHLLVTSDNGNIVVRKYLHVSLGRSEEKPDKGLR